MTILTFKTPAGLAHVDAKEVIAIYDESTETPAGAARVRCNVQLRLPTSDDQSDGVFLCTELSDDVLRRWKQALAGHNVAP